MSAIGVLGAGSWGTALAVHLAGAGHHAVTLWARSGELAARLAATRVNELYLPGVALPPEIRPTAAPAALATRTFRLYSSQDVAGVELGGAAKNVVAIAAGTVAGLGAGHNTLAALITRGLHEITRLGVAYGGQARTFAGLAGLGDLVLTCT